MNYFQVFLKEGYMDIILSVQPEGPRFTSRKEADSFYKEGGYFNKSHGSTESNSEYVIMEVKNGKLHLFGSVVKRTADTKNGDFVILSDESGADKVYVETANGMELLTWRDNSPDI